MLCAYNLKQEDQLHLMGRGLKGAGVLRLRSCSSSTRLVDLGAPRFGEYGGHTSGAIPGYQHKTAVDSSLMVRQNFLAAGFRFPLVPIDTA
jgi:hypothetical protein